jgi:pyrroline-5-carboxylate reductase
MQSPTIGMIGAGQMASALAAGFLRAGLVEKDRLLAADPAADARRRFAELTGAQVLEDNRAVLAEADVIILAVKPQQMAAVAEQLRGQVAPKQLVVSIAAGVRLHQLAEWLGSETRLVRVMPNTPSLVGQGASGYSLGAQATEADAALVQQLLEAVGLACRVPEPLLDAVTGLSGSGPAFIYTVIEALSDAGVRHGLPRTVAAPLAAQTVRGAAEMVLRTGEHPAVLRERVTSPGGTTIAGLEALEQTGLRGSLLAAVEAATERSRELGE